MLCVQHYRASDTAPRYTGRDANVVATTARDLDGPFARRLAEPHQLIWSGENGDFYSTRPVRDFRIRCEKCGSRTGTGDAHEPEVTNVYAVGFPSICSNGDGGCDTRHGANAFGGQSSRQRSAPRRAGPGLFPRMESSCLSLVRAPRIGALADSEPVALAGAAAPR
jgi:hypothetical protein